jgi:hypothetical protein
MKMFDVLKLGNSLSNPSLWKKIQSLVNLLSGTAPLIIIAVPATRDLLTENNILALSSSVAAMNIYFTNATSEKVGF